jgi:hypothetical protein
MGRIKVVVGILIALSLMIWTVQPAMACSSGSGDGSDPPGSGIAAKLVFIHQPTNTIAGTSISPAVTIAVQDAYGHTITSSTLAITVVIKNNPLGGKLAGTTHINAVKGVATFANLSIDKASTGYTLKATAGCELTGTSNFFNIMASSPTPVVTTPAPVVTSPIVTTPVVTSIGQTTPALLEVSVTGLVVKTPPMLIDQGGYIHGDYELQSTDGTVTLDVPNNNGCWDNEGHALTSISAGITTTTPVTSGDNAVVLAYAFGPDGANFNPALTLTLKYDTAVSTANVLENSLYAEGWDGTEGQMLTGVINKAQKTITIQISHFSTYVVIGKVLPPPLVTAVAVPPTTNAIDQVVSLISASETNPSSSSLVATASIAAPDAITTPDVPQQTPTPNVLAVNSQPNHVSIGLILVGIAAGLVLIILLAIWIARHRAPWY